MRNNTFINITVWGSKIDPWPRNMLLIKNPQFLPNYYETLSKLPTIFINNIIMGQGSILLPHTVRLFRKLIKFSFSDKQNQIFKAI